MIKEILFTMCASAMAFSPLNSENIVIFLGPPGSGKGTQAKEVAESFKIPHISTGDLFRENLKNNTPLGLQVKDFMDAGKLVPDQIVIEMLKSRISLPDSQNGYVLDGFPRSIPQAEALESLLAGKTYKVINLQVSDEEVVRRIEGRRTCPNCKATFNTYTSPSKKGEQCENCDEKLTQRSDDTKEVVVERLRQYHAQTAPLIDYYKKKGRLSDVNGEQDPKKVFEDIMKILK
jgi:adenylate kinase